jgi:hypothetical protein
MAAHSKILNHPDRDEIIKLLSEGTPVRKISDMLDARYPKKHQAHLRVSFPTLHEFKTSHLNLKGKIVSDVQKEQTRASKDWLQHEEVKSELEKSSAYREAITKVANSELDSRKEILKIFALVEGRLEILYNKVNGKEVIRNDEEKLLQSYIDQLMRVMDQYKKYIDGFKETTEHNINITIATSQVNLLREAIRETLSDCDPALAIKFMEKIYTKMRALEYEGGDTNNAAFLNSALGAAPIIDEQVYDADEVHDA